MSKRQAHEEPWRPYRGPYCSPGSGQVYVLPSATTTTKGGVKPDGTTITIDNDGTIHAPTTSYTLPQATTTTLGGVKVDGTSITATAGVISTAAYTLPQATTTTLGGVKVDGTTIQIDNNGTIKVPKIEPYGKNGTQYIVPINQQTLVPRATNFGAVSLPPLDPTTGVTTPIPFGLAVDANGYMTTNNMPAKSSYLPISSNQNLGLVWLDYSEDGTNPLTVDSSGRLNINKASVLLRGTFLPDIYSFTIDGTGKASIRLDNTKGLQTTNNGIGLLLGSHLSIYTGLRVSSYGLSIELRQADSRVGYGSALRTWYFNGESYPNDISNGLNVEYDNTTITTNILNQLIVPFNSSFTKSGLADTATIGLTPATTTTLGGVKVDGTTITASAGVISATQQSPYTLPQATTTTLGGVKVDGTTITYATNGVISAAHTCITAQFKSTVHGGEHLLTLQNAVLQPPAPSGVLVTSNYIQVPAGTYHITATGTMYPSGLSTFFGLFLIYQTATTYVEPSTSNLWTYTYGSTIGYGAVNIVFPVGIASTLTFTNNTFIALLGYNLSLPGTAFTLTKAQALPSDYQFSDGEINVIKLR